MREMSWKYSNQQVNDIGMRRREKKNEKYQLSVPHSYFPRVNGNKSFFVLSNIPFCLCNFSLYKKLAPKILFLTIQQTKTNEKVVTKHHWACKICCECWKLVSLFVSCLTPHRMWLCERMVVRTKSTERKWLFIFKFIVQLPFDDPSFILH